jgi:hypothetical protein
MLFNATGTKQLVLFFLMKTKQLQKQAASAAAFVEDKNKNKNKNVSEKLPGKRKKKPMQLVSQPNKLNKQNNREKPKKPGNSKKSRKQHWKQNHRKRLSLKPMLIPEHLLSSCFS